MQEFNKGYVAGVCSLAGFIVVYLTVYQLIVERINARRIEDAQKITASFERCQEILREGGPFMFGRAPADENGSDQASSSASNLSGADVKQGDDR